MSDFPVKGTICADCRIRPAAVFSGGVAVCWECDEAAPKASTPAENSRSKAPAKRRFFPKAAKPAPPGPEPLHQQSANGSPSGERLVTVTYLNDQGHPLLMPEIGAALAQAAAEVQDQRVNAAEALEDAAARMRDWYAEQRPCDEPATNHYAAVIADLEEKRKNLLVDLQAIDDCLPVLRAIKARQIATANQPEKLNA